MPLNTRKDDTLLSQTATAPKAPSRSETGQAWLQVTQEGKASPSNSHCVASNLPPCREVGLPPQQFKAPTTDSRQPHPPGGRKRKTWGWGWGHPSCQLTSCTFRAFY